MPLYVYECPICRCRFDAFATMARCSAPAKCIRCLTPSPRLLVPVTVVSDCTQYRSDNTDGTQFANKDMANFHLAKARAAGVTTSGKSYYPELARYPGDPQAWCGSSDDIRRVARKEGYDVDGDVKVRARDRSIEPEKGGLNEKTVNERVNELLAKDPGMKRSKAVEDVVNKHAPASTKRIVKNKPKRKVA
jgi:predicted nucleic acid-binding Zn ribbon protein